MKEDDTCGFKRRLQVNAYNVLKYGKPRES
jgi:hypothetical protein